jgi:hypothetical protein
MPNRLMILSYVVLGREYTTQVMLSVLRAGFAGNTSLVDVARKDCGREYYSTV